MKESGDRLESWKAIAVYLNRGVRTVRRWEHDEGLPIHRHLHHTLGSVYAFKSEIDAWQQAGSRGPSALDSASRVRSIVVLPFANLSEDRSDEFFADGLTGEIIADLSTVRTLSVISRTSSMTLKRSPKDVRAIAAELDVDYVVEGSARRDGSRVRVTVHLIDAARDGHLWSSRLDETIEDAFAIQERLARNIVAALRVTLTSDEERRIAAHAIPDTRAYECYLRAREEGWRWRRDSIDRAIHLLETGLAIVGDNPQLHAAMGMAFLSTGRPASMSPPNPSSGRKSALAACSRSIQRRRRDYACAAGFTTRAGGPRPPSTIWRRRWLASPTTQTHCCCSATAI